MKTALLSLGLAILALPSIAATNVSVSIGIDRPGVYGRFDIGRVSAPPVPVHPQPVWVVAHPVPVRQRPIYLHVPPGHAKHWRKHCGVYYACGQRVAFVQPAWYPQDHVGGYGRGHAHGKPRD